MNITISKRAKSSHQLIPANPQIAKNQQLTKRSQSSLNKQRNVESVRHEQQQSQYCKWFFQKCLRKPSDVEQLAKNQSISLKKTNVIHKITCRQAKKNILHIEREPKINLLCKNKTNINNQQLQIKIVSSQWLNRQVENSKQRGSNLNREINQDNKPLAFASFTTSNQTSKQKICPNNNYSLKPSTYVSNSSNNSNKLQLSNHFVPNLQTNIKPFTYSHRIYQHQEKVIPISEEVVSQSISRFEIVNPSQQQGNTIDLQNESINTSYIRKKIQFSSEFSDKNKYENYIYQPIYKIHHQDKPSSNNDDTHKSCFSQLIKAVNVDDHHFFSSAKSLQEESVVLQKGLEDIFNHSPAFRKLSEQKIEEIQIHQAINSEEDQHYKNILNYYQDSDQILQISN